MKFNQLRRLLFTILVITAALVLKFTFSACDTDDRESDVVPHEHEAGEWEITVEPTCTAEGARVQKCTICEAEMTTETIDATGHIAGSWTVTKEATCTVAGEQVQKCSSCGEVVATEELSMTEHVSGEWKTVVAASCTSEGSRKKACAVCSKELATEIVPMHPNTVNQSEIPATCLNTGLTSGSYCPDCNTVFVEQTVIPIADHAWVTDAAISATCEHEGLTQGRHCSVCNLVQLPQEVIPKTDHNIVDVPAIKPTCTTTGKTAGTQCSMCKTYMVQPQLISALGHDIDYSIGGCTTCGYTFSASEMYTETLYYEDPYSWDPNGVPYPYSHEFEFTFSDTFKKAVNNNPTREVIVTITFYAKNDAGWKLHDIYLSNLEEGGEKYIIADGEQKLDSDVYTKVQKQFTINASLLQNGKMYLFVTHGMVLIGHNYYHLKNITLTAAFADAGQ